MGYLEECADAYTKALFGRHAIRLPLNLIAQDMRDGKVVGVFQTSVGTPLLFGGKKTHQLIIADVVLRPQLVFESDEFRGCGINSLLTNGFAEQEKWIDNCLFKIE